MAFRLPSVKSFKDIEVGDVVSITYVGRYHKVVRVFKHSERYISIDCVVLSSNSSLYSKKENVEYTESNRYETFTYAKDTPVIILNVEQI